MNNIIYSSYISSNPTDKYCKMLEFNKYFLNTSSKKVYSDRMYMFFDVMFNANHCKKYGLKLTDGTVTLYDYDYLDDSITVCTGITEGMFSLYVKTSLTNGQIIIKPNFELASFYIPLDMQPFDTLESDIPNLKASVHRDILYPSEKEEQKMYAMQYDGNWKNYSSLSYTYLLKEGNKVCLCGSCSNDVDIPSEWENGTLICTVPDITLLPDTIMSSSATVYVTKSFTDSEGNTSTIETFEQQGVVRLNNTTGEIKLYGKFTTFRRIDFDFNYIIRKT